MTFFTSPGSNMAEEIARIKHYVTDPFIRGDAHGRTKEQSNVISPFLIFH